MNTDGIPDTRLRQSDQTLGAAILSKFNLLTNGRQDPVSTQRMKSHARGLYLLN